MQRRNFLAGASLATASLESAQKQPDWAVVEPPPSNVERVWIGPGFWANRLQDWRLSNGSIESTSKEPVRTLAVLSRELNPSNGPAHIGVSIRRLQGEQGFSGLLIGGGSGQLDWRSAALVQQSSGSGGGLLCTWEADGRLTFREHTDESRPLAFSPIPGTKSSGSATPNQETELRIGILPAASGKVRLELAALDSGRETARAMLDNVDAKLVTGGLMLVSSGALYSYRNLRTAGVGVALHPERRFGPIAGTLYSLNNGVLKMTAQLLPIGSAEPQRAFLEVRSGNAWRRVAEAEIESGFTALFRVERWDARREQPYRIVWGQSTYEGIIRKEPSPTDPLTIGLVNCVCPVGRNLDAGPPPAPLPGGNPIGRYEPRNVEFPFIQLVTNVVSKRPDLMVYSGDQIYEGRPTRTDPSPEPTLDYLYKWYLWHWAFQDLTRSLPSIVQVDDHDMYQGNIWGQGGRPAPDRDQNRGGYVRSPSWVNMVQRAQCGHNPDPFDPTPIDQGISVYYGAFRYGGVNFAILEDRKFKVGANADPGTDLASAPLLGDRQEQFLRKWAAGLNAGEPRICLTQTTFACANTTPEGQPRSDRDSNGYPKPGRDRAIRLFRDAGALILSGDQHLTHVIRHGLDGFDDGPVQFTAPAGGSLWARWFAPTGDRSNATGPHTGDFMDGFGNRFRVMAVANPPISSAQFKAARPGRSQTIEDPGLRADGFGIARVDKTRKVFVLECWPAGTNPKYPASRQFAGWPIEVPWARS